MKGSVKTGDLLLWGRWSCESQPLCSAELQTGNDVAILIGLKPGTLIHIDKDVEVTA